MALNIILGIILFICIMFVEKEYGAVLYVFIIIMFMVLGDYGAWGIVKAALLTYLIMKISDLSYRMNKERDIENKRS